MWDKGVKQGLYWIPWYEVATEKEKSGAGRVKGRKGEMGRDREKERDGGGAEGVGECTPRDPRGLAGGTGSVGGRARVNKRPSAVMAASATSDAFRWLFSPGCLDVA